MHSTCMFGVIFEKYYLLEFVTRMPCWMETRFYFEYVIDFSRTNQGSLLASKFRQVYCLYCSRLTLISKPIPN